MALVGHWKLQDNAASTTVVATVGTNGSLSGAGNTSASAVAGPGTLLTSALDLDGTNDQIAITTSNGAMCQNKGVITVCGWAKPDAGGSGAKILFRASTGTGTRRLSFSLQSTGFLDVSTRAGDAESLQTKTTTAEYDDGNWHHFAAVIDYANDTITIYVDGSSVTSTGTIAFTATATGNTASTYTALGSDATSFFNGALADWRVYDSNESANLATIIAEKDIPPDVTAPTVTSATVDSAGTSYTMVFSEAVNISSAAGHSLTATGGAVTLTYASGSGSDTIVFSPSRTILDEEVLTRDYVSGSGNTEDAAGNDLASYSGAAVSNLSMQEASGLGPDPLPPDTFEVPYSLPTGGTTYTPADSAALTTALAAAVGGDVIVLTAGVTYTGPFKLRNWGAGTNWIYIVSDALSSLPAEGTRVDLDDIDNMPTITSAANAPLHSDFASHHYRLVGVRIITEAADRLATVQLGYGGDFTTNATTAAQLPTDITFDRCVIGSTSDAHRLRHGIMLNGRNMAVVECYIYNCKDTADAQAIWTFNGGDHFKIVNNYLEASGENYLTGGTDPQIPNAVTSDVEFVGNYLSKPLAWKTPNLWTFKNLFELKNTRRVLVEGNVMENNWTDGQNGIAVLLTVRNQGGNAPWSVNKDVDIQNNILRNIGGAFNITGSDDLQVSQQTRRVRIHNNLVLDVTDDYSVGPSFIQTGTTDTPILDFTFTHNTCLTPADEDGPGNHINLVNDNENIDGLVCQDNIMTHGSFTPTWARTTNSTHDHNVLIMIAANSRYATNKTNFASQQPGDFMADPENDSVGFVDWENGNYRLDASSTFKGDGTLGSDPGINQDELEVATAGAISGVWSEASVVAAHARMGLGIGLGL